MVRSVPTCVSLIGLLVVLAGCELDGLMEAYTPCFNPETKTYYAYCCDKGTDKERRCDPPDAGDDAEADAADDGEADAGADDGGPPTAVCPWPCTSTGGGGFDAFPSYVWMGSEAKSPPNTLDGFAWTSWVDVKFSDPICPACSCTAPSAPEDGCVLPAVWSAESTMCQDPSTSSVTPFDPPLNWAGSCTSANPIEGGVMCDGEPCVKSLVVKPPTIAPCVVAPEMPPEGQALPPPTRMKVVEYVAGTFPGTCSSTRNCIAPPSTGFRLCLVANDDASVAACPDDWTDRYTGWRTISDTRACSPCTCGAPEGASCEVLATVYADDACGNLRGSLVLPSNEEAKCTDVPMGSALGSKSAEILSYQAGTCTPSTSDVIGTANMERPVTFCCIPDPAMPQ